MNMVDKVNRKNYANLIFNCSLQLRCIHGLSATTLIMLYSRHNSAGYIRVTDSNEHVFFLFFFIFYSRLSLKGTPRKKYATSRPKVTVV